MIDDRALEATARLHPNGARGALRGVLVGLLEEQVSARPERNDRHSEQHIRDGVGLSHGVHVAGLAVRSTTLELVLLVSSVERVNAPSAERHEPHASEYV